VVSVPSSGSGAGIFSVVGQQCCWPGLFIYLFIYVV
jgi:hypothetical protein